MSTSRETHDAEYRAFLAKGEVRLQRCEDCGYMRPPTSWICPECLGERWQWSAVEGGAWVEACAWYMQSFHPRFTDVPYNVALVRLDEGVRMIANVEGVAVGELHAGQRVRAEIAVGRQGRPTVSFRREAAAPASAIHSGKKTS